MTVESGSHRTWTLVAASLTLATLLSRRSWPRGTQIAVFAGGPDEFNRIKGRCGKGATSESGVVEVASIKGQNSQFEEQAL